MWVYVCVCVCVCVWRLEAPVHFIARHEGVYRENNTQKWVKCMIWPQVCRAPARAKKHTFQNKMRRCTC